MNALPISKKYSTNDFTAWTKVGLFLSLFFSFFSFFFQILVFIFFIHFDSCQTKATKVCSRKASDNFVPKKNENIIGCSGNYNIFYISAFGFIVIFIGHVLKQFNKNCSICAWCIPL